MKQKIIAESQIRKLVSEIMSIDEMADRPHETKSWMPIFDQLNDYVIPPHLRTLQTKDINTKTYIDKGGKFRSGKMIGTMIGQIRGCESVLGFIQIAVLFPSSKGQTVAEFTENHKDVITEIRKEYPYVVIMPESERMSQELIRSKKHSDVINKDNPNLNVDLQYKPSGESLSITAKLNKSLNQILKYHFENNAVTEHLHGRLIPPIRIDFDRGDRGYFPVSNETIKKSFKNFYHFKSNFDFNDAVNDMYLNGKTDVDYLETHQRYQFNQTYGNWSEKKRALLRPDATKTPVYKLDSRGYSEENFHILGVSELTLHGTHYRENNTFTWTISFSTRFGKRAENTDNIVGTISIFRPIVKTTTVQYLKEYDFPQVKNPEKESGEVVLSSPEIKNGLLDVCKELVKEILNIDGDREKMLAFSEIDAETAGVDVDTIFEEITNKVINQLRKNG
jgi:hypothetical protein